MTINAVRYHDISCGHRVHGHESVCKNLHGHNYRITFTCRGELDGVGRVIDFAIIKSTLCEWLESAWDHRMLIWQFDPLLDKLREIDSSVVCVPFNPTAENMASHLLVVVGPSLLSSSGVTLAAVKVEETRKCAATAEISHD